MYSHLLRSGEKYPLSFSLFSLEVIFGEFETLDRQLFLFCYEQSYSWIENNFTSVETRIFKSIRSSIETFRFEIRFFT